MIRLFAGYDPRTAAGHHTFVHSVYRRATLPVAITPLRLSTLENLFNRPRHPLQSTDFAFTRFLVPYLCGYDGWALFADGADMLCLDDLAKLWAFRDSHYAVQVVKHNQPDGERRKFLDEPQTPYDRKNWSSLILFNCTRCARLTPEVVEQAGGLWLHQFRWLEDAEIGELPTEWNTLVDVQPSEGAKLLHYTLGIPPLYPVRDTQANDLWHNEYESMLRDAAWQR